MLKKRLEQILSLKIITYSKDEAKSTMDLVFKDEWLWKNMVFYDISQNHNHNLDYMPILLK